MRAWDVTWGTVTARRGDRERVRRASRRRSREGDGRMDVAGRFSLGYPRRDGGEEIDARIAGRRGGPWRICATPSARRLPGDGRAVAANSTSTTATRRRRGSAGWRSLSVATAYGETFESGERRASASRATACGSTASRLRKGAGTVTGAAYVGWDGTYSFNADGGGIPWKGWSARRLPAGAALGHSCTSRRRAAGTSTSPLRGRGAHRRSVPRATRASARSAAA